VLARDKAELERLIEARTRDLEQTQAQLAHAQRMTALGALAGGIAHDFNNLLQAIQGSLSLIERRPEDAERVLRYTGVAGEAARRGVAITRRLLAFARRGDLHAEAVDPVKLLERLREMLEPTLSAGVRVRLQAKRGLPPLMADPAELETVLVNLAANACDAMPEGGTLTLSAGLDRVETAGAAHGPAPGRYVRLSVSDTGQGMAPDVLARVTEPFFTTKPRGKGTGLGLSMAKGFAEQSGGAIAIESSPGCGTIVTLWLPQTAAPPAAAPRPAPSETVRAHAPRRILLVDDDAEVRTVLADQLEAAGYRVLAARTGPEALTLLDQGAAADLLMSDLSMPDMGGIELIAEARRRRPGLPAILLTGFATDAAEFSEGAFSVVQKPVETSALGERIEALLECVRGTSASSAAHG
jgi:nitrogen-specific signal transduction histidine kinase/ActR/RegA family two-component response regulator